MDSSSSRIYKILNLEQYHTLKNTGEFTGSDADKKDRFIHLCYSEQLDKTVAKWFNGQGELMICEFDAKEHNHVKIENGFPHIYEPSLKSDKIKSEFKYIPKE
jgi:uncharacterized protein (DUF952 family)